MKKIKIRVEVNRFARFFTVRPGKIEVPAKITSRTVVYRSGHHFISVFMFIVALALSIALFRVLGFLAIAALLMLTVVVWRVDSARRRAEVGKLMTLLPENAVVDIVRESISRCSSSDEAYINFEYGDIDVEARCGTPYKCVEFDRHNAKKLSAVYLGLAVMLVVSYMLPPTISLPILLTALIIVLSTSRTRVCRKYLVKKESVILDVQL